MDTSTRTSRPTYQRRPSPVRRLVLRALVVAGLTVGVALALLLGFRIARPGALPNTSVGDVPVGGLETAGLRERLDVLAEQRGREPVEVSRGEEQITATAAELGYRLDVDATVDAVLARGRQANLAVALVDHLRAFGSGIVVPPVETVDEAVSRDWADRAATQLSADAVEGGLRVEGVTVTAVEPQPGARVAAAALADRVRAAALTPGPAKVTVDAEVVVPVTTSEDVAAVAADAQRALAAAVTLRRNDGVLTVKPVELGELLDVDVVGDAPRGRRLRLVVPPGELADFVPASTVDGFETDPVDARFEVRGESVAIVPSRDGFRFVPATAAAQLVEVATGTGPRDVELVGEVLRPERTTEQARALGITEKVSEFTTYHACCQGRVTNIHRIADAVNGVVIEPGETFSLNGHVGERTTEKGYVGGGAIYEGEFVEQVGGGVSQFTTTMYNAAWFGGYAIPDHKAHSYYISRYPAGREATLNYPNVDLKIRNTSPHGILVRTSYSSTSITVAFYGTKWVEVETITGERRNARQPETRYRENPALPPGAQRVVEDGRPGFDITVTRVLRFPDGRVEREEVFTRYLPEPRIVERNTATPQPQPSPGDGGQGAAQPEPQPTP